MRIPKEIMDLIKKRNKLLCGTNDLEIELGKRAGKNGLIPDSKKDGDYYIIKKLVDKNFKELQSFNKSIEGKKLQAFYRTIPIVERMKLIRTY